MSRSILCHTNRVGSFGTHDLFAEPERIETAELVYVQTRPASTRSANARYRHPGNGLYADLSVSSLLDTEMRYPPKSWPTSGGA